MKLLYKYLNGENEVELYDDGTKIRKVRGENEFPESCDIKLLQWCDGGCAWCYESSTTRGKFGDLSLVLELYKNMPAGVEKSYGGGEPLSHPDFVSLLKEDKRRNHIANVTVNQIHWRVRLKIIENLISEDLVKGIGLSVRDVATLDKFDYQHLVFHLIMGVHSYYDFMSLRKRFPDCKILILGYKEFGFGVKKGKNVHANIRTWRANLPVLVHAGRLSFDNLSIEQLQIKRFFDEDQWQTSYMGNEGSASMYLDLVEKTFASHSYSSRRLPIQHDCIKKIFRDVKAKLVS